MLRGRTKAISVGGVAVTLCSLPHLSAQRMAQARAIDG